MTCQRFASLLLSVLLAACLLAGCGKKAAPASSEAAPASSEAAESAPSSSEESASSDPVAEENTAGSITDPAAAFEPCLGWGPGTAGVSLKSVRAAASLLHWAEENGMSRQSEDAVTDVFTAWYKSLNELDQETLAEAWPLIRQEANALLTSKADMTGRIEDAGLDPKELPGCSLKNWQALETVLDASIPEAKGEY